MDALAMTEPEAGSDVRGMKCTAVRDGGDWVVNGTKHFISGADHADFFIVFIATGCGRDAQRPEEADHLFPGGSRHPGFTVRDGYRRSATGATRTASSNSTIAACRMRRCWARSMAGSR
jgi:acyl-CoA dehydrogenase